MKPPRLDEAAERRAMPNELPAPEQVEVFGGPGGLTRASFTEAWGYREVLRAFVSRRVRVKYKQTSVGLAWVVVQPVLSALLFTVFLGRVARVGSDGAPYFIFALTGMVFWTFFAASITQGGDSIINDAGLLRKVYFPREFIPLAAVTSCLVDLLPALVVLLVAVPLAGVAVSVTWLVIPLLLLVLLPVSAAGALLFSALTVYLRDIKHALPFLVQLGLFSSPVVYSYAGLSGSQRQTAEILNPLAGIIDAARRSILHAQWPDWFTLLGAGLWSILLLWGSYAFFKRVERGFADRA